MNSAHLERSSRRRFSVILILILVVIVIMVGIWLYRQRTECTPYNETIQWVSEYTVPVEKVALPSGAQVCLTGRHNIDPSPILLPEEEGVELLLALESHRPDILIAGPGIIWDGVMGNSWFQARYTPVSEYTPEQNYAIQQVYVYHPVGWDTGEPYQVEYVDPSESHPALWGYRLAFPYITAEHPCIISLYWQNNSASLAMEAPVPGYQLRIQLVSQSSGKVWSQVSQPLVLEYQPVAKQLRLSSPLIQLPSGHQPLAGDLLLQAHLLHPDGRSLPLYSGDSLANLPYLPDSQFTQFPTMESKEWQFGSDITEPSVALKGIDMPSYTFAGEDAEVVLVWQALTSLTQDYIVFVHLIDDANGTELLVAQDDSLPASWRVPTSSWTEGMYIRDVHWISIPADISRGEYKVYTGLYHVETGVRMQVSGPGTPTLTDRILLGSVWVR